jgi:hypothetical protein
VRRRLQYQTNLQNLPQRLTDAQSFSTLHFLHLPRTARVDLVLKKGCDAPIIVHEIDTEQLWYWTGYRWKLLTDYYTTFEYTIQPGQTVIADRIPQSEFCSASYRITLEGGGACKLVLLDAINRGSFPGDMVIQIGAMKVDLNTDFSAGFFELKAYNRETHPVRFTATREQ